MLFCRKIFPMKVFHNEKMHEIELYFEKRISLNASSNVVLTLAILLTTTFNGYICFVKWYITLDGAGLCETNSDSYTFGLKVIVMPFFQPLIHSKSQPPPLPNFVNKLLFSISWSTFLHTHYGMHFILLSISLGGIKL